MAQRVRGFSGRPAPVNDDHFSFGGRTAAPAYRADVELLLEFLPALVPAAREIASQLPAL